MVFQDGALASGDKTFSEHVRAMRGGVVFVQ
jgi:hypothetical protein